LDAQFAADEPDGEPGSSEDAARFQLAHLNLNENSLAMGDHSVGRRELNDVEFERRQKLANCMLKMYEEGTTGSNVRDFANSNVNTQAEVFEVDVERDLNAEAEERERRQREEAEAAAYDDNVRGVDRLPEA
jgi:hypothetical protein